jgi:hypothetical protein
MQETPFFFTLKMELQESILFKILRFLDQNGERERERGGECESLRVEK